MAAYRSYAERWSARLAREVPTLKAALASGDRDAAKQAWTDAYDDYLHLGAVYGLLPGTIDQRIDGMPERLAGAAHDPGFTGLHRIEMGLWTGAAPAVPGGAGDEARSTMSATCSTYCPGSQIEPLDYATRAHEILEDAQRDLMSGTDVPLERRRRARDRRRAGRDPRGDRHADAAAAGPRQHARSRFRAGCCGCSRCSTESATPTTAAGRRSTS